MRVLLSSILLALSPASWACYNAYNYADGYKVATLMNGKAFEENPKVSGILHVRTLEDAKKKPYTLFWLEDTTQALIDTNSRFAPFLVVNEETTEKNPAPYFQMQSLKSLAKDRKIKEKQVALVDRLQYQTKEGTYQFLSQDGAVEIEQGAAEKNGISLQAKQYFQKGKPRDDIKIAQSHFSLMPSADCFIEKLIGTEQVLADVPMVKGKLDSSRTLSVTLAEKKQRLPDDHWFMQLGTDPSTWKLPVEVVKEEIMSIEQARSEFEQHHASMLSLYKDNKGFEEWVAANIAFLKNLPQLLKEKAIDEAVIKTLLAELGYLDTVETVDILMNITLDAGIEDEQRFRSVLALMQTTASMDNGKLNQLISIAIQPEDKADDPIQGIAARALGAYAKERFDSEPEQANYITDKLVTLAQSYQETNVAPIVALGNIQEAAPDRALNTVESAMLNSANRDTRIAAASALTRIKRTNLDSRTFEQQWNKEGAIVKKNIVEASVFATDIKGSSTYQQSLLGLVKNEGDEALRVAAIQSLGKSDYGKADAEKAVLKDLISKESERAVLFELRDLYRGESAGKLKKMPNNKP